MTAFPRVETAPGAFRRVLSHTPELMMVEFTFQKGAEGALHHHPHLQATYVKEGRFRFFVDGEERIVAAGDTVLVPSNVVHGCVALEAGTLIDTFAPRRADFL